MGRTIPTTRQKIEEMREEMEPFRRAMKPQYKGSFDALFHNINYHAMPANFQGGLDIQWLLLFTACIGQQREIDELREELEELREEE